MAYGKIEYNDDGQPKCEICNQYFNRVIPHARQKHSINEKEYKAKFGFDSKKGICSKESSEKTSLKTLSNYDKCITRNLNIKGSKARFVKGSAGRGKEMVSEQTKLRLKARLKETYMVDAMQKSGKKVGESGLGNKKRWGKNKEE
jgi:hypothetical protein